MQETNMNNVIKGENIKFPIGLNKEIGKPQEIRIGKEIKFMYI